MMRKPRVATETKWPDSRMSGAPTRKASTMQTRPATMVDGEESKLESGYPGGQIGQIACLGRGGEREHTRDIGAHADETHMAQRKDPGEAVGQPHGDDQHGIDAHDRQNADEIVVHQRGRGDAEQTQQDEAGDDDKEALHPAHSFTS